MATSQPNYIGNIQLQWSMSKCKDNYIICIKIPFLQINWNNSVVKIN